MFSVHFTYVYFISNYLDTDIDIETHDNSHLIPTAKLYRTVIIHLYIHMVLNKFKSNFSRK